MNINIVTIIGNLTTDVEIREVDGKKLASFVVAVDRASAKDDAHDLVPVCAWDRHAELCAEYLAKGRRIAVDGWLKTRTWEEDGERRTAMEVVARRVEFFGGPPS